jgi:hypothetical protein
MWRAFDRPEKSVHRSIALLLLFYRVSPSIFLATMMTALKVLAVNRSRMHEPFIPSPIKHVLLHIASNLSLLHATSQSRPRLSDH